MSEPRVVVADDSHFMRSVISDILADGGVDVVGRARNGREAVSLVADVSPDVVTMDVEMPGMDGIEATERIMAESPTPILMLSAHTDENADVTFEALDRGAVDFLTKPGGEVSMELSRLQDRLVETVKSVAADGAATAGGTAAGPPATGGAASTETAPPDTRAGAASTTAIPEHAPVADGTLVVGSSTGGPKQVERVLGELPREANLRVLIVQHMPAGFTGRFADRIDTRSEYAVREAADGEWVDGGEALVAPGSSHMLVAAYRDGRLQVTLSDDPPVNSVRPAVDVTMGSAAEVLGERLGGRLVGVVLTGMGEDGAAGTTAIKAVGGRTIAQDEATSAVFGMPKRAIETGHVDQVLPIEAVAGGILADGTAVTEQ